jgi:zinc/manganese transport system permease protein
MMDLLLAPFVAAMIILLTHAYFGLHIIQRGVIFVDLALAQIAALGGTVGFLLGAEPGSDTIYLFSFGFTLLGALIFSGTRMKESPVPQEALIGITYVVASAAVLLLAGLTSEGSEHIRESLTGSLIWVTWPVVGKMVLSYGAVGLFHFLFRRPLLAITFSPKRDRRVFFWDLMFYASFGFAVTSSVNTAGVLMVFSVLVIPAVVAFFFTQRFSRALWVAYGVGTAAIVLGLFISFTLDWATGPVLVCSFGLFLLLALFLRPWFGVRVKSPEEARLVVRMFAEQDA